GPAALELANEVCQSSNYPKKTSCQCPAGGILLHSISHGEGRDAVISIIRQDFKCGSVYGSMFYSSDEGNASRISTAAHLCSASDARQFRLRAISISSLRSMKFVVRNAFGND